MSDKREISVVVRWKE